MAHSSRHRLHPFLYIGTPTGKVFTSERVPSMKQALPSFLLTKKSYTHTKPLELQLRIYRQLQVYSAKVSGGNGIVQQCTLAHRAWRLCVPTKPNNIARLLFPFPFSFSQCVYSNLTKHGLQPSLSISQGPFCPAPWYSKEEKRSELTMVSTHTPTLFLFFFF